LLNKNFDKIIFELFLFFYLKLIFLWIVYRFTLIGYLIIIPLVIVSGKPPLLVIITAHPQLADSRLVLPKGSSHLEHTTDILDFLK
jgi:hypothetical protein